MQTQMLDFLLYAFFFVAIIVLVYIIRRLKARRTRPRPANYDEAKVPSYTLPELLRMANGKTVRDSNMWWRQRRPEILGLYEQYVFGKTPDQTVEMQFETTSEDATALDGAATCKQIAIHLGNDRGKVTLNLLLYRPNDISNPAPAFLGMNFYGNQTVHKDPNITLTQHWVGNHKPFGITENRATESSRGTQSRRWPVKHIVARGYALATLYYGDVDPDFDDAFQNGVHPLFYSTNQNAPAKNEWGSIGAWAWGLSRVMDFFEQDPTIDQQRVAVMGHSRLGKAALWAGSQDQRFALVVSNNSGCGGATLSRRRFGETIAHVNRKFPHWFCRNFHRYSNKEKKLPVDQHMLISLIAPRPVYVASAEEDHWADPRGEFLSTKYAHAAYELLGTQGLPLREMPAVNQPTMGTLGYHIRSGEHDVTLYDWERYMDFADLHIKKPSALDLS